MLFDFSGIGALYVDVATGAEVDPVVVGIGSLKFVGACAIVKAHKDYALSSFIS